MSGGQSLGAVGSDGVPTYSDRHTVAPWCLRSAIMPFANNIFAAAAAMPLLPNPYFVRSSSPSAYNIKARSLLLVAFGGCTFVMEWTGSEQKHSERQDTEHLFEISGCPPLMSFTSDCIQSLAHAVVILNNLGMHQRLGEWFNKISCKQIDSGFEHELKWWRAVPTVESGWM